MRVSVCVPRVSGASGGQKRLPMSIGIPPWKHPIRSAEAIESVEPESQTVVSLWPARWVLRTEPGSSSRMGCALNYGAISLALNFWLLILLPLPPKVLRLQAWAVRPGLWLLLWQKPCDLEEQQACISSLLRLDPTPTPTPLLFMNLQLFFSQMPWAEHKPLKSSLTLQDAASL